MIIVGILVTARNQMRKTKIRRKKDRCSVFMSRDFCLSCHGDALWADTSGGNRLCWLVLLLHVCMCPCAAHTNTHTHTQTNVQYGAFEEWSLTEPQHQPVKNIAIPWKRQSVHVQRTKGEGRGTYTTYWGRLAFSEPSQTRWWSI